MARTVDDDEPGRARFAAIGRFLCDHGLSPDPVHYAFAYRITCEPDGVLARTVAGLTDGGVRLNANDVAAMSGGSTDSEPSVNSDAGLLADRTEHQLREFAELMAKVRAETTGFGRDLAATVEALNLADPPNVLQLTVAMLDRVRSTEAQLEEAKHETETLREQLEVARGDARNDTLTGLPNRRALLEDFAVRASGGAPLYLAVCDIDHFKRINDRFGHPIGDRVLRAIAGALSEACGGAFVTRYGGEEFAALFTGGELADAVATLDRARAVIAAKRYKVRDDDTPLGAVTFSAGIVAVAKDEAFDTAFDRADALLYAAKKDGRNQIRH